MMYTHPDLDGIHGNSGFTLNGVQYPSVWWRTVTRDEIEALGFVPFIEPEPEPEPERLPVLQPYQFWTVMRVTNHEADLRDWVTSLNDEQSPNYDPVTWSYASSVIDYSLEYRRDHPLVEAARQVMGVTVSELDDLWAYAATL